MQEASWQGHHLVVAHHPERAREQTAKHRQTNAELELRAQQLAGKLDAQDAGKKSRGRKMSDSGTKARFYREVCDAHLASIIRVDLKGDLFSYEINEPTLARTQMMDGKLLLVTNVPGADLTLEEVLVRHVPHKTA